MSKKKKLDRRNFLKMSAVSAAAGGVALTTKSASADTVQFGKKLGYRETELIKTYYSTARF